MSPIIARTALRATRAAAQAQHRRPFSAMQAVRNMARSLESQSPFHRVPESARPQAGDWSKLIKRSAGNAAL